MKTDKIVIHYFESSDIFYYSRRFANWKKLEIVAQLYYSLLYWMGEMPKNPVERVIFNNQQ